MHVHRLPVGKQLGQGGTLGGVMPMEEDSEIESSANTPQLNEEQRNQMFEDAANRMKHQFLNNAIIGK